MADSGNIVNLNKNWSPEQLVTKQNYNNQNLRSAIEQLRKDIASGSVVAAKARKSKSSNNSVTSSGFESSGGNVYNTYNSYDGGGSGDWDLDEVKNQVTDIEDQANQVITKVDEVNKKADEIKADVETKVSNDEFSSYQKQTADLIASKVSNDEFASYQTQTADLIASKVSNSEFSSYTAQVPGMITSQVASATGNMTRTTQTADGWQIGAYKDGNELTGFFKWTSTENSIYIGNMNANVGLKLSNEQVAFSNGIELNSSGLKGVFYVTESLAKTVTVKESAKSCTFSWLTSELTGNQRIPNGYRPVALVRLASNHGDYFKVSGWNLNPGYTDKAHAYVNDIPTHVGLTVRLTRYRNWKWSSAKKKAVDSYPKISLTCYVQILWARIDIDFVSDVDTSIGDGEDTDDSDDGGTDGRKNVTGTYDATTKKLTLYLED